jgi:hypothetical protein
MSKPYFGAALAAAFSLSGASALAVPAVPEEGGWSGFVNIGVGVGSSESNLLAELFGQDLGDDTISSLDSGPDDEDVVLPAAQYEVAYTFSDLDMQLFLGNRPRDHILTDMDLPGETRAGVRQDMDGVGTVEFALGFAAVATDVWEDPYVVDESRGNTEMTSSGLNIAWSRIFDSGFGVTYITTEIELDDERSGQDGDLGLSRAEQRDLRREGQYKRWDITWNWRINERHRLVPGIGYIDADFDGDAMAEDGPVVHLQHHFSVDRWRVVSRLFFEALESDEVNPIYGDERDVDTLGGSVTVFLQEPFGLENWTANAGVVYYDGDANIDFYDSTFGMLSVGMLYTFD